MQPTVSRPIVGVLTLRTSIVLAPLRAPETSPSRHPSAVTGSRQAADLSFVGLAP